MSIKEKNWDYIEAIEEIVWDKLYYILMDLVDDCYYKKGNGRLGIDTFDEIGEVFENFQLRGGM